MLTALLAACALTCTDSLPISSTASLVLFADGTVAASGFSGTMFKRPDGSTTIYPTGGFGACAVNGFLYLCGGQWVGRLRKSDGRVETWPFSGAFAQAIAASDSELFICDSQDVTVHVWSFTGQFKRVIRLPYAPYGIAYANGKLFLTDNDFTVERRDLSGNLETSWACIHAFGLSISGQTLLVTSWPLYGNIRRFDFDGNELCGFTAAEPPTRQALETPQGIWVTQPSNVGLYKDTTVPTRRTTWGVLKLLYR
jgi:hypothetical protein